MRIVGVDKLNPGDVLGKSIFNNRGELLLTSGYQLNAEMIRLVKSKGYRFVYVMDELTESIVPEDVISDAVRQVANQKLAEQFKNVQSNLAFETFAPDEIKKRLEDDPKIRNVVKIATVRQQVNQVIEEIVERQVTMFTSLPMKTEEGMQYEHAFDTTVMCVLIAQEFRYDHREMRALGNAAMVHDIGKIAFGKTAEKKQNELTRDEKMLLREHPVYSGLILRGSDPNTFLEQTTVMQHHERYDGKGFPRGLRGGKNPPAPGKQSKPGEMVRHSEILAVANDYDNYINGSATGTAMSPDEAMVKMIEGSGTAYHPAVVKMLNRVVMRFPVGSTVIIRKNSSGAYEGYTGVIMKANEVDQSKPIILLTHNAVGAEVVPRPVDLKDERYVHIELAM